MENYNGKSLIDIAEIILNEKKESTSMYELFDIACERKGIEASLKDNLVAQFYTDMISSARFVYLGDNEWDLKENQEITLWEKDGSYYKEYNKVEMAEEVTQEEKPVKEKPVKAKPAKAKPVKVEEVQPEVVKETVEVKPVVEKIEKIEIEEVIPNQALEFEEELFEDYEDDFDEEKYNEYMDTYEDQYDD